MAMKMPTQQGNYIDTFVKQMFGRVLVFVDFLDNYADPKFVAEIDIAKTAPAPTHYIGHKGDERIIDLVFQCPLKNGVGHMMAVIVFEHKSKNLKEIPQKLHKYISAIWDAETKEGKKVLSAPYFIVLRTAKTPHRGKYPTMADLLPKRNNGEPWEHVPEIKSDVVDLPAWDFDKLVGGAVLRSALGMLHKMTGGAEDEFPEALLPLLEIDDEKQRIELTKELLGFVDKAFTAHNRRLDKTLVSRALKPIFRDKEQAMRKTFFEELEEVGEARGEARGIARGIARGKAETILTILRAKFRRVPRDTEKAIRQITDPIALDSWAVQAATCQSIDEFAEALQ